MSVPSQMSIRQFPRVLWPRMMIAHSAAWEALIDTHRNQALQFIQDFAKRISLSEALELYFRVVAVQAAMQEPVRTRTLVALDLETLPSRVPLPTVRGWKLLRLDLVFDTLRYRRAYNQKTIELARFAGARASEAVLATHVSNAIGFSQLLEGFLPLEKAVGHYLQEFRLAMATSQLVTQRVQAAVASQRLAAQSAPHLIITPSVEAASFASSSAAPVLGPAGGAG